MSMSTLKIAPSETPKEQEKTEIEDKENLGLNFENIPKRPPKSKAFKRKQAWTLDVKPVLRPTNSHRLLRM